MDKFVVHVTNFLTDVFQQTNTPLGVQVNQVTVTQPSVSNFQAETTGDVTLTVKVVVDSNYASPKTTPFSMPSNGKHTFAAPSSISTGGFVYNFVQWQDENSAVVSRSPTFTYNLQSSKTFTAIYARPSYTLVVIVYDSVTHKPVAGASISLDDDAKGSTGSNGKLTISGVTVGNHHLDITMTGYDDFGPTTIEIRWNRAYIAYLLPSSE